MNVNFSERNFEAYFNSELDYKYGSMSFLNPSFTPSPLEEADLGFDKMIYFQKWRVLWPDWMGYCPRFLNGVTRNNLQSLGRRYNEIFPKLKANIFLQYKRPQYLNTSRASEWQSWKKPYYRFSTRDGQHELLVRLDKIAGKKAAVLYVAPVCCSHEQLIDFAKDGLIVENSIKVPAEYLANHKRCTYIDAVSQPKGHSEAVDLPSFDFSQFLSERKESGGISFTQNIKELGTLILKTTDADPSHTNVLKLTRQLILKNVSEETLNEISGTWLDHWFTIHALSLAFSINVLSFK